MSFVVLLLWIPLREKPGLGTISNALVVGFAADATPGVPAAGLDGAADRADARRRALCGLATAMYIGAQFGRGPRDGLMTGLARRTGRSLRLVRTCLEVTVVLVGLLLGGALGLGHGPLRAGDRAAHPALAAGLDDRTPQTWADSYMIYSWPTARSRTSTSQPQRSTATSSCSGS